MSDEALVDIGDELVVRIAGYPVGNATVEGIDERGVMILLEGHDGGAWFLLPLDFKNYDITDGVAHGLG